MKTALISLLAAGILTLGLVVAGMARREHVAAGPPLGLRTATVTRGEVVSTIDATGIVTPEEVVDVGAQIGGKIKSLGIDPGDPQKKKIVDYGSTVNEGMVLATIDDTIYKAQVDDAEATLQRAQADLEQAQAKLDEALEEWQRAKSLLPTKAIADSDYDAISANYRAARATVTARKAAVRQSEAMLRLSRTNLSYTVIRSPVSGMILERRVNVGQTVVAAFNAPSLFLIARNLHKMQVLVSVNESDIGRIRTNMPVSFTVDTFPDLLFRGVVSQIRLNATINENVVSYIVVVATDNADGKLFPYSTATLQFEVDHRSDVLLVPNEALRWRPRPEQMPPELREARLASVYGDDETGAGASAMATSGGKAGHLGAGRPSRSSRGSVDRCHVWVARGSFVRPIEVQIGITDGLMTEVSGRDVKEGMAVVVGESCAEGDAVSLLSSHSAARSHKS